MQERALYIGSVHQFHTGYIIYNTDILNIKYIYKYIDKCVDKLNNICYNNIASAAKRCVYASGCGKF